MRVWVILLFFLAIPIPSYSLDASTFFNALETRDIECVLNALEINSSTTPKEILHFLKTIKETCEDNYNVSISLSHLQQDILDICKNTISDPDCLYRVEIFLNELFYPDTVNIFSQFILLISDKKQHSVFQDKDIPISVILGCIEIGCGALLWVTPFRAIGNILIGDGCRRMLNEVENIEKVRNSSYKMNCQGSSVPIFFPFSESSSDSLFESFCKGDSFDTFKLLSKAEISRDGCWQEVLSNSPAKED